MVRISGLEQEILKFDERILDIGKNLEILENYDKGDIRDVRRILASLDAVLDQYRSYEALIDETGFTLPLDEEQFLSDDYHSYLALGMIGHDLAGSLGSLNDKRELIALHLEKNRIERTSGYIDDSRKFYKDSIHTLALMPYVVSGDRRFLFSTTKEEIEKKLRRIPYTNIILDMQGMDELATDQAFCISQLVKNSRDAYLRKKQKGRKAVNVSVGRQGSLVKVTVTDRATGIRKDELPYIFDNYTTDSITGRGLGLQLVKRLVELRNGYVDVFSRHGSDVTYAFDTISRTVMTNDAIKLGRNGTKFMLYFRE